MPLLTGMTEDGTEVPVQVAADGRLVAEGLQGIAGPQGTVGPAGPQGPQGPKGDVSLDPQGRLLVGTSTAFAAGAAAPNAKIQLVGNSADAAGTTILALGRGEAASGITTGEGLGIIAFCDNAGNEFGTITCAADGTAGTNDYPGRLVFSTTADGASSPTERMRITQQGDVLISNTNRATQGRLCVDGIASTQPAISCFQNATTTQEQITFRNPNSVVGTITTNGSTTAYNQSSDYRLKENVTAVSDGITRLQQLKPSRFNFIAAPDCIVDGFIAHEVQAVVPEAVTGEKDAVDSDGNPKYQGIDQSKLVPLLTAALQEAIGEIESLKARVVALESA